MRIAIGSDHAGFRLKERIKGYLLGIGVEVLDCGTFSEDSCDYPIFCYSVAQKVVKGRAKFGILICKTGIGSSIAANKVKGARAGLCHNETAAKLTREHNHSNILVMGSMFVSFSKAKRIIEAFFSAQPQSGRHRRRVNEIRMIEDATLLKEFQLPRCRRYRPCSG